MRRTKTGVGRKAFELNLLKKSRHGPGMRIRHAVPLHVFLRSSSSSTTPWRGYENAFDGRHGPRRRDDARSGGALAAQDKKMMKPSDLGRRLLQRRRRRVPRRSQRDRRHGQHGGYLGGSTFGPTAKSTSTAAPRSTTASRSQPAWSWRARATTPRPTRSITTSCRSPARSARSSSAARPAPAAMIGGYERHRDRRGRAPPLRQLGRQCRQGRHLHPRWATSTRRRSPTSRRSFGGFQVGMSYSPEIERVDGQRPRQCRHRDA